MVIKSVFVENFRSIKREILVCDPLTVVVGANGAGKSSFLQALAVFYDINARIDIEDFCGKNVDQVITIRITYGDLREEEKEEFGTYIHGDTLTVTKRITCTAGRIEQRYYAAALQLPAFVQIRSLSSKRDQIRGWNELVESGQPAGLQKVKKAEEIEPFMAAYEAAHPDLLESTEREEQFFGPRNVGGGKLDKFTKFVHLPAVREVTDETGGRNATLTQLIDTLVMRKVQAREDVQVFRTEFGDRLKNLYAPEKTAELKGLAQDISQTLAQLVPGATFDLEFGEVKLPDLPTPSAVPSLTEDAFPGDISRKGHGLQRALIFSLLQHLAVLKRDEVQVGDHGEEKPAGADLILAVEEPELYQHPQRCRYLADLFLALAAKPGQGVGARNQVLYTTHSAYFVSLDRFEQIRVARKPP
jgi:hypothetical protein